MRTRDRILLWVFSGIMLLFLINVFWASFISREKTLYAWDHVAYWSMSSQLAKDLTRAPLETLSKVGTSIWEDELNLLPALPLTPGVILGEYSRTSYILSVLNVYCLPALFLGFFCLKSLFPGRKKEQLQAWLLTILLLPAFWQPMSLGYLGAGGLAIAFLILLLGLGRDNFSISRAISLGFLLALLTLFRRWWAFWSLSFCLLWALDLLIHAWKLRSRGEKEKAQLLFKRVFLTGSATVFLLLLLGGKRIYDIATTNYAGRFVHYQGYDGIGREIFRVVEEFGLIALLLIIIGIFSHLRTRKGGRITVFLSAHLLLTAFLFRRVQLPSPQHWYLLMPGVFLLLATGITSLFRIKAATLRRATISILGIFSLLLSLSVFARPLLPSFIAPAIRIVPKNRGDIPEIERLMGFLDSRLEIREGWIYVLSGTGNLPESGLAFINYSLGTHFNAASRILESQKIDLRDGFPKGIFRASYILVPEPPQYRGKGTTQQVLRIPSMDFFHHSGIASAFVPVGPKFRLAGETEVRVFERVRPNTSEEIKDLERRLKTFYPREPFVWKPVLSP